MATSWIKRRHSLSTSADVCLSTTFGSTFSIGFIVGLILRYCSRRASVERSLCLKLTMSQFQRPAFPQSADDALRVTSPKAPFCVQNFFLEALSLQPGRERYTATTVTLWCSIAKATVAVLSRHEVSPRLARQCGSQDLEKQRVQANGSNLQVLLNKVRTLGCKSSLKRQTQGRLEGDR